MNGPVRRLDDNLELRGDAVHCRRCGARVGSSAAWLDRAPVVERPAGETPGFRRAAPELFVDAPVVQRQAFCPGCLTVLLTEVVAAGDRALRAKRVGPPREFPPSGSLSTNEQGSRP